METIGFIFALVVAVRRGQLSADDAIELIRERLKE